MDEWYKMFLDYEDKKVVSDAREPVVKFLNDWGVKVNNFKITHAPGSWVSGFDDDERSSAGINEDYRKLAKKRMGAETRNSIKVGTIVDYYDNNGNKRTGKIIKIGQIGDGYTLKDTKDNKVYKFKFYDKMKAKKLLAANVESNSQEVQEGLFDKLMKKWKGKGKIKKKREKLVKVQENIFDVYRQMNEQPLTGYGYRSTERDSNVAARVADWKKKKSEETKVEALQKKLEFARKQRQRHDDAAEEYREKAEKVRERNPDDRAADNYDMKADNQEEMAHKQNNKVQDLKDAIRKEKGIKDSYSPDPMSSIIQEFNINMPDKVKNQVIGLYNKAMDVKHNSPEHKSIKKEIGMIMKKYS